MINKNKKQYIIVAVMILIIAIIIGLSILSINRAIKMEAVNLPSFKLPQSSADSQIKNETVVQLKNLKQYGQWPIEQVPLSPARGNPFAEK